LLSLSSCIAVAAVGVFRGVFGCGAGVPSTPLALLLLLLAGVVYFIQYL
jgi:uncharacterized membrane protein YfcA